MVARPCEFESHPAHKNNAVTIYWSQHYLFIEVKQI